MFDKLIEFFIPKGSATSGDELRSDKIFVAVLLISALSNLLGINLAWEIDATINGYLLLINGIINLVILIAFRLGLAKSTATVLFITQFAFSFPIQAYLQGGLASPAAAALFLLPAIAMLILGKRAAIFWMVVSALLSLGLFIFELYYGEPIPQYNLDKKQLFYFSSILGTNFTIFIILLVYELGKSKVLREIQLKNNELVNTQKQLIQQEKLASLGQLTAGIAHEIKNPLNFILNFTEVNKELLEEFKENLKNGDTADNEDLLKDIENNLQKIQEHGARADSIVKSMLGHSRSGSGEKFPTDINALAEEFLRLSYHGLRAKDKFFNAEISTNFDPNLPPVNIIPQDIGRVLLNLINNAFQACATEEIENPKVTVTTKDAEEWIQIAVSDNGPGIPEAIKDKIFQPFFTTKPTGQGTGLGLSLSYDIIKAHGGELKVESQEKVGTTFFVYLKK